MNLYLDLKFERRSFTEKESVPSIENKIKLKGFIRLAVTMADWARLALKYIGKSDKILWKWVPGKFKSQKKKKKEKLCQKWTESKLTKYKTKDEAPGLDVRLRFWGFTARRRKASYRKRSRRQRTLPGTKSKFQLVSWKVVIMAMKRAWKLYPWTLESGAKARCLPRVMRGKRVIQES